MSTSTSTRARKKCDLCENIDGKGYYVRCGHFYCRDCIRMMTRQSTELKVKCSFTNCGGFLDNEEIISLVSAEVFQEYIERIFGRKRKLDSDMIEDSQGPKVKRSSGVPVLVVQNAQITTRVQNVVVPTQNIVPEKEELEETPEEEDMTSGFGQLTATATFLIAAGYSHEEALRYLETQSVLLTIKPITCCICLEDDVQPGDGIIIKNCLHMLCRNCLINYIDSSELSEIECPCTDGENKCHEVLLPLEIRELCSLETYEKHYVDLSLKAAQESGGMSHCMTPNCRYFCELDREFCYQCPFCYEDNCFRCTAQHTGMTCEDYHRKLEEEQEARDATDPAKREKLIQQQNERLSQATLERERAKGKVRPCPKCQVLIQKEGGCDHMKCKKCGHNYNWSAVSPKKQKG